MSYAKITLQNDAIANRIRFYYLVSTVLRKVEKITSYKSASITKTDGQADFDRLLASVDEKELLIEYMEEALIEIFDLFFHLLASDTVNHNTPAMVPGEETPISATLMVPGNVYTISTVGTTDFTLVGARENAADVVFTATGTATGTGQVDRTPYISYADIRDNAKYRNISLDLIDKRIAGAIVDFILSKWYVLKVMPDDAKIHLAEYQKALAEISKRTLALRQY